jgi:aerobic carbon-monoxide dehydrogenase medium subunit
MISHDFDYHTPTTIADAVALLARHGDRSAVVGGGTWLIPNMTYGAQRPEVVIDAKRLQLDRIFEDGGDIVVGARASYGQVALSGLISANVKLLAVMSSGITGGPQIVRQGTLGGSACYGNPSSDVPACLVALNARLRLQSAAGVRDVPAAGFFHAPFVTAKRPDEILTEIRLPKQAGSVRTGYYKLKFSTGSWPIVTAACLAERAGAGHFALRIAIGGANSIPVSFETRTPVVPRIEDLSAITASVGDLIVSEVSDEFAGSGYRRTVAPSIVIRAVRMAIQGDR